MIVKNPLKFFINVILAVSYVSNLTLVFLYGKIQYNTIQNTRMIKRHNNFDGLGLVIV